jgi:hypothetical protein
MVRTVRGDVTALHPLERDGAISRSIWATRDWEPFVGAVLERLAGRGQVVYDVGANIGFFTLVAARSVGREGLVVAIEPDPDTGAHFDDGDVTVDGRDRRVAPGSEGETPSFPGGSRENPRLERDVPPFRNAPAHATAVRAAARRRS